MKKFLISLLACLCIGTASVGFAACSDDEVSSSSETSQQSSVSVSVEESENSEYIDSEDAQSSSSLESSAPESSSNEDSSSSEDSASEEDSTSEEDSSVEGHTHVWDDGEITTAPSCEGKGEKTYSCACGESYTEEVAATGHSYTPHVTAPTCTAQGYTAYVCGCGNATIGDYVGALGHDYVNHAGQAATCTAIGWEAYQTCDRAGCAYTTYAEIDALGHNYVDRAGEAATCTTIGWEAYQICDRVGCTHTTYEEIDALGHDYVNHAGQAATCTEIGWDAYETCNRAGCAYTTYAEIGALGHQWTETEEQEKTCTQDGIYNSVCTREACGIETTRIVTAEGHQYGEWSETKAATCYQDGAKKQICTVCENEKSEVIPALSHAYSPVSMELLTDGRTITYECQHCHDTQVLQENERAEDLNKIQYEFDCEDDFTFLLKSDKDETYIRNNMRFINAYFEGTEYESNENVQVSYTLTSLGNGEWRVSGDNAYEAGQTYLVELRDGVQFKDYRANKLKFQIIKPDSQTAELKSEVKFLKTLERRTPGYYPYEVTISEEAEAMWLTVGKADGFAVGDILCIGDVETKDELLAYGGDDVYFGKVETIRARMDGGYLIGLSCPEMSEVFDDLDVSTTEVVNFDDYAVNINQDIEREGKQALYSNEEFLKFLSSMELASRKYLKEKNCSDKVFSNKTIADYMDFNFRHRIEGLMVYIYIDGSITVPMEYGEEGKSFGTISISFSLTLEAGFEVRLGYRIYTFFFIPYKMDYFEVQLVRSTMVEFNFDLSITAKYELEGDVEYQSKEYILNTKYDTLHQGSCKHIASIKDKTNLQKLTAEDALKKYYDGQCNPCGTCCPIDRMLATQYLVHKTEGTVHSPDCPHVRNVTMYYLTYDTFEDLAATGCVACLDCQPEKREERGFQAHLLDEVLSADMEATMSELKKALNSSAPSPEKESKLHIATLPMVIGWFHIDVDISVVFNFNFEATVKYEYKMVNEAVYGLQLRNGRISTYSTEYKEVEKNKLEIIGKLTIKAGVSMDVSVGITGFKWLVSAGLDTEVGLYAKANGIITIDAVEEEAFAAAYFEAGIYVDMDVYYKLLIWGGSHDLLEKEFPLYQAGYDKAYYNYVDRIETIETDGDYTLSAQDLVTVKYYDMHKMQAGTETLNLNGVPNLYAVHLILEDGSYCYISNGKLMIKDNAPARFTDVLLVAVEGLADGAAYIEGCSLFYLVPYEVTIVYDNSAHIWSETQRVEPTCTTEGYVRYVCVNPDCLDCDGVAQEKQETLVATGHTVVEEPLVLQTCTEDGHTMGKYCSSCGVVLLEKHILPATGHNLLWHEAQAPTCTEAGWEAYQACWNRDCTYNTRVEIPAIGHDFTNENCSRCGVSVDAILSFSLNNGTYTVTGLKDKTITTLSIPANYEERAITAIAYRAFYYCDNLTSVVIGDNVTTIGTYAFYDCYSLTSVVIGNSVTTIGDRAFYNCDSLTSVVIGDSVTTIGTSAFSWCSSLTSVVIPDSVTSIGYDAFYNCDSLTSVVIGDSVTSIASHAFSGCSSLTSMVIPDSVTSIGEQAFYDCTALTAIQYNATECADLTYNNAVFSSAGKNGSGITVTIGANVKKIPAYLFYPYNNSSYSPKILSVEFEEGSVCESIGNYAFAYCDSLTSVVIPDSVTTIGDNAFSGCDSLTSVVIGDSVTIIGDYAFHNCSSLTSVEIPDSVTTIGSSAFAYCSGLTSIVIPDSVTLIENQAFCGCDALTEITLPFVGSDRDGNNPAFGYIFYDNKNLPASLKKVTITSATMLGYGAFRDCSGLTSVDMGDGITLIGDYAFSGCSSLTSIAIPDSVTTINYGAFQNCTALTSVYITDLAAWCNITFANSTDATPFWYAKNLYVNDELVTELVVPDGVTTISGRAFQDCDSLTSVVIPDNVTTIGNGAFYGCYRLAEVVNKSPFITITKGSEDNGWIGYYAVTVYNSESGIIESQLFNDNGYIICTDGEEKILVGYSGTEIDLVLPSYITKINQFAFYDCGSLTSIVIPNSVTTIGEYAFAKCYSFTSVVIGDSVTTIGSYAFSSCTALTEMQYNATECQDLINENGVFYNVGKNADGIKVTIGANVKTIPAYLFYPYKKSDNSTSPNVISVDFEEGSVCESIGNYAFIYCISLTSVEIPNGVTTIGDAAFAFCSSLTCIVIPDSVTTIASNVFNGCSSLMNIEVSENNSVYKDVDGNLYSKDGMLFIQYAIGKTATEFIIPDGVTTIGAYAFCGSRNLKSVVLPESVKFIERYAFYDSGLNRLHINGTSTWYRTKNVDNWQNQTSGGRTDVSNFNTNATYFKSTYCDYYWYKL